MITTITGNEWIPLQEQRNGVDVQRKFAGLDTRLNSNNTIRYCHVYYFERELYPNGEVNKEFEKWYSLEDLAPQDCEFEGAPFYMEALAVLSGFVQNLGLPYIINPARGTLSDTEKLRLDAENGYPLHRDTRHMFPKMD